MEVIAMDEARNAYGQVLFQKGKHYKVTSALTGSRIFVFNELHTESPFPRRRFHELFEIIEK